MALRIGVDLGGTKIEAIALDPAGREVFRKRIAAPRGVYADTVGAIVGLVRDAESALGGEGSVGIGIPGSLSRKTGLVKGANSTWLIGRALKDDLQDALKREIRIENDANCFALSEAVDGAGKGASVVFGVILGTGVGGGIVIDGKVLGGINAIAGEWGHNPLPALTAEDLPPPDCYCGRKGCIETYLSGPGLARDHKRLTGSELRPEDIVAGKKAKGKLPGFSELEQRYNSVQLATLVDAPPAPQPGDRASGWWWWCGRGQCGRHGRRPPSARSGWGATWTSAPGASPSAIPVRS